MTTGSLLLLAAALLSLDVTRSSVAEDQRPLHLRVEREGNQLVARVIARASPPVRVRFVLEINAPSFTRHAGLVEARPSEQVISTIRFRAADEWTARLTVKPATGGTYVEDAEAGNLG